MIRVNIDEYFTKPKDIMELVNAGQDIEVEQNGVVIMLLCGGDIQGLSEEENNRINKWLEERGIKD